MNLVTYLYYYDKCGMEEIYLSKFLIEICNKEYCYSVDFGRVLLENLPQKISKLTIKNENEMELNLGIDENLYWNEYRQFIEKINQSDYKNILRDNLNERNFKKGIYAVTISTLSNDMILNLHKKICDTRENYIGYFTFDTKDLLLRYLLYEIMFNGYISGDKFYISDNIYFQDKVEDIIGKNKCEFVHTYDMKNYMNKNTLNEDHIKDHTEDYYQYSKYNNFWDNFISAVFRYEFRYKSSNYHPIKKETTKETIIEREDKFNFKYIKDMSKKLTKYCLNLEHYKGKHKARVFESALDIKQDDYILLQSQLKQGFIFNKIEVNNIDSNGIKFQIIIPVIGKNGKKAWVKSGWIFEQYEVEKFHLTTAVVLDKNKQKDISMMKIRLWLDCNDTKDSAYYCKVYQLAQKYADCVIQNYNNAPCYISDISGKRSLIKHGAFGNAAVKIEDNNFEKWLLNTKIATKNNNSTIIWIDKEFKYDKSLEYAYSLAIVFEINGITTSVEAYYD